MCHSRSERLELVVSSLESMGDSELRTYEERIDRLYVQYLNDELPRSIGRRVRQLHEHLEFVVSGCKLMTKEEACV